MKNVIILVVIVIAILGAIFFLNRSKEESKTVETASGEQVTTGLVDSATKAKEGEIAPDFTLIDFEGNTVKLSDLKGKGVFIDFWAAWCPFCTDEMPDIEKLHQEFGDEVVILGIHRTATEAKGTGEDFAKNEVGVTYTILQDKTDDVYKAYTVGIGGMPVAVWIDKDGKIVKLKTGPKTPEEMRKNVEAIL